MPQLSTAPYGVPCDTWGGHPALHQEEARRVLGYVPPFTWVVTCCRNKFCVTREHLIIRRPLHLGYPNGICIYCGLMASTMDHLLPEPWTGEAARHGVATVPACRDCNTAINDSLTFNITERRAVAHDSIRHRNRKWLTCKFFTHEELEEMGHNLRTHCKEAMQLRAITEARLAWPLDPFYDLRAAQDVGIENPYVIGMLTEEAA